MAKWGMKKGKLLINYVQKMAIALLALNHANQYNRRINMKLIGLYIAILIIIL